MSYIYVTVCRSVESGVEKPPRREWTNGLLIKNPDTYVPGSEKKAAVGLDEPTAEVR